MSRLKNYFIVFLLLAVIGLTVASFRPVEQPLPSTSDVQQFLVVKGYLTPADVDGICGKVTQAAWDAYICDVYAAKTFGSYKIAKEK